MKDEVHTWKKNIRKSQSNDQKVVMEVLGSCKKSVERRSVHLEGRRRRQRPDAKRRRKNGQSTCNAARNYTIMRISNGKMKSSRSWRRTCQGFQEK